jgi:hypothetical protein
MLKEAEIYRIWHDENEDFVHMQWCGYANSRQFREGTEMMLQAMQEHNSGKVLGDIKNMVLISQADQQWVIDHFLPKAMQAGFRALALVQPDNYFNKIAVETIAWKVNQEKLKIRFFNNVEEAREWLLFV